MTEPAQTAQRLLRLLGLLQVRAVWTGPELAERLGVTTRSIRRDVERLRALGYPVVAGSGPGGGYQLGAGREMPPLLLADDEAIAVALSLRLAARAAVTGLDDAAVSALVKLDQVMPAALRARIDALTAATVTLDRATEPADAETLTLLAEAIRDRRQARLTYVSRDGVRTERRVEPHRLAAVDRRWYLMAYDLDRDDWRTFRLDRVQDARPSTFPARDRDAPDPVAYVRSSVTTAPYPVSATVIVHADAARIGPLPPGVGELTPLGDERCRFVCGASDLDEIACNLGRFGAPIEVVEPPELADALRTVADRLRGCGIDRRPVSGQTGHTDESEETHDRDV